MIDDEEWAWAPGRRCRDPCASGGRLSDQLLVDPIATDGTTADLALINRDILLLRLQLDAIQAGR